MHRACRQVAWAVWAAWITEPPAAAAARNGHRFTLDDGGSGARRGGGILVESDEFRFGIGLLLEPLHTDRNQRPDDRGFSALSCHFIGSAAERPSELRQLDEGERNSADHCTRHRWFHPGWIST